MTVSENRTELTANPILEWSHGRKVERHYMDFGSGALGGRPEGDRATSSGEASLVQMLA